MISEETIAEVRAVAEQNHERSKLADEFNARVERLFTSTAAREALTVSFRCGLFCQKGVYLTEVDLRDQLQELEGIFKVWGRLFNVGLNARIEIIEHDLT